MSGGGRGAVGDGLDGAGDALDRDLADLPPDLRRREWMGRLEAVLFASAAPVDREALARLVGQGASLEALIEDIRAELADRPYELVAVGGAWMLRTRPRFAGAIAATADSGADPGARGFTEMELAVLCAVAYHQPIDRAGLAAIFGKAVSREVLARLRARALITTGPRSPRPGAPQTFVTTEAFLATFGLETLRDLPDMEMGEMPDGKTVVG